MILTIILMLLIFTACGNTQNGNEVRIGYFNNITHCQALYMKSQQSLEQALGSDIAVTYTAFNAGPAEVEALFSENIDIGYIGPVPAINAREKSNGDIEILTGVSKGGAIMVKRPDSSLKSIEDLDGKSIAVPQIGNTQHLCLLHLLNEHGLKPTTDGGTVTVRAVSNSDIANVMERGDIDAAFVPEPWGSTLLQQGAELLLDYDEVYMNGAYDVAVVVVRKEFREKNPAIVKAFLEQHELATKAIITEPETAWSIINNELKVSTGKELSEDVLKEATSRLQVDTKINTDALNEFEIICLEQGLLKKK